MGNSTREVVERVVQASNRLERNKSDLKRQYFINNISRFNLITKFVRANKGSFGTGYPFYTLSQKLEGTMPTIQEQIRYNYELIESADNSKQGEWICKQYIIYILLILIQFKL